MQVRKAPPALGRPTAHGGAQAPQTGVPAATLGPSGRQAPVQLFFLSQVRLPAPPGETKRPFRVTIRPHAERSSQRGRVAAPRAEWTVSHSGGRIEGDAGSSACIGWAFRDALPAESRFSRSFIEFSPLMYGLKGNHPRCLERDLGKQHRPLSRKRPSPFISAPKSMRLGRISRFSLLGHT